MFVIIPVLIQKVRFLRKMPWLYAAAGIIGLLAVLAFGITSSGAKISISIAGISVQPSEFVKIIFVFFVACMLYENTDLKHVCIATVLAAVHVLILVLSRDLGGALIFFVTYLVMLYVATQKAVLFCGRTSDRMYCRGGGISAVFPRARACPGMAGSALKN